MARDVRAMPIKLISVTKGNSKGAALMSSEWLGKLQRLAGAHWPPAPMHTVLSPFAWMNLTHTVRCSRYTSVTEVQVKPNPLRTSLPGKQIEAEAEKVRCTCMRGHLPQLPMRAGH